MTQESAEALMILDEQREKQRERAAFERAPRTSSQFVKDVRETYKKARNFDLTSSPVLRDVDIAILHAAGKAQLYIVVHAQYLPNGAQPKHLLEAMQKRHPEMQFSLKRIDTVGVDVLEFSIE